MRTVAGGQGSVVSAPAVRFRFLVLLILALVATPSSGQRARQQQTEEPDRPLIDVDTYTIDASFVPEERKLAAKAWIRFRQLDRQNYAAFDLDRRLRVSGAYIGDTAVRYRQFDLDSTVEVDLSSQQFAQEPVIRLEYAGVLAPDEDRRNPILANVTGESALLLYDAKWFPTNGLFRDRASTVLRITTPEGWNVVTDLPPAAPAAAGATKAFASPAPSFWGTVVAGAYTTTPVSSDRYELSLNTVKATPENAAPVGETAAKVLGFYSDTFGPLAARGFRLVEVEGVNWPMRGAVGMLLLSGSQMRTDFDASALARGIAQQWFPLKVAVKDPSTDAWLMDGMAAFASLLYFEKSLAPVEAQEFVDRTQIKALSYEGDVSVVRAGSLETSSPEYTALASYKGAYVLRMLRWVIGEEKFQQLLSAMMKTFESTPMSTDAFTALASRTAGEDLTYFFDQWLNSTGVPEFTQDYTIFRTDQGYKIMGQIKQDLDLFKMPVELRIETDGEPEYRTVVVVGPSSDFDVTTERKPKAVSIDARKKILRMSDDIRVAVHINRGEELGNRGEYNDAIQEYQKAVDIDKLSSLALFRMGEALFEQGNLQGAANVLREALNGDLKPRWVEVWTYVNLGKIFDIRGQRERAVTEYQKAVNTGDDAYGAQAEAQKYLNEPFRRSGRPTIG